MDFTRQPLRSVIRPTTFIESVRLSHRLGARAVLASETFQHTGSFKFRAAYNVAVSVPQTHIITASSGNFGQGLAYACRLLGKSCTVVMPDSSAQVKVEAVREFGGAVELIDVQKTTRQARVKELAHAFPDAYAASAYDDPLVIDGNATLGDELAAAPYRFDVVISPVGGGGLTSGILTGLRRSGSLVPVVGVEPLLANDAARSMRAGELLSNEGEPQTIADGVRTLSLGRHNWAILKNGLESVIEVSEENIRDSIRLLFALANLKAEPTGALSVAALLAAPDLFRDQRVCCVISGGNVDAPAFARIVSA